MTIPITGAMLKAIENNHQYEIVEMGIRFGPGKDLQLPPNLDVIRLEFDADLVFFFEFGN